MLEQPPREHRLPGERRPHERSARARRPTPSRCYATWMTPCIHGWMTHRKYSVDPAGAETIQLTDPFAHDCCW